MTMPRNEISNLVDTFVKGGDLEQTAFGEGEADHTTSEEAPAAVEDWRNADLELEEDDPIAEALLGAAEDDKESEDNEQTSENDDSEKVEASAADTDDEVEYISVTDDSGKRKVKIDWNDRERLKKFVAKAYGMRKFQAERDQYKKKYEEHVASTSEELESMSAINEAYQSGGIEAVVDLIEGDGAFAAAVSERQKLDEWKSNASESELAAYEKDQRLQKMQSQLEAERKAREEFEARMEGEADAAETKSLQAQLYPAFDKYRFEGKLSDPSTETRLDKMLWRSAKADLAELLEDEVELTPAIVEKTFKENYLLLKRSENKRAERKATRTIAKKKQEAIENAQTSAMKGMNETSKSKDMRAALDKGDISSLLSKFTKW